MSDALLSPAVGLGLGALTAGALAWAARRFAEEAGYQEKMPLAGVLGAFVFGAQMLNFSIPATGSSGHIGGGLLLAVMLGPWAGFLTVAAVLVIQCLFFADGGLLALGCNVFNLGFWPCFVGLPLYRAMTGGKGAPGRQMPAAIVAVVASLELGAFSVVVQTLLSGRTELPFGAFAPIMLGIHLPIGLVEGMLTATVLQFVFRTRPELAATGGAVSAQASAPSRWKPVAVGFALVALFFAGVGSWFASARPDGLEWSIARVSGTRTRELAPAGVSKLFVTIQEKTALLPDYNFRKPELATVQAGKKSEGEEMPSAAWPTVDARASFAGIVGAALTALLAAAGIGALAFVRGRRKGREPVTESP